MVLDMVCPRDGGRFGTLLRRSCLGALWLTLAVALWGCGDSATDPLPDDEPTVLTQDFSDLPVNTDELLFYFEIQVFVAANLSASVAWTPVEADVDLGIVTGRCLTDGCDLATDVIAVSAGLDNPEAAAVDVAPGNYTIAIENLGPGEASGTITVTITPS